MQPSGRGSSGDRDSSDASEVGVAGSPAHGSRPARDRRGQAARHGGGTWARLFGYDVFVSFALGAPPRGSRSYASDLVRRLRERGFTVFFSEDEAPVGDQLDPTLQRALVRSRVLVVVANRGTLADPRWVRQEVESFRRQHPGRRVVPISIDGALQDPALADAADAWLGFRGRIWIDEVAVAAQEGVVSDEVVERLATAPRAVRSATWLRATVTGLVLFFIGLAGVATWQRQEAVRERDRALATSLYDRVRTELASGSLAQAARIALAGRQRFADEPMARQALADVASHPGAALLTVREPLDSEPRVEFSPDGRHLLSVSRGLQSSHDARVRDLRGRELHAFASVRSAEFAAGGREILLLRPGAPEFQQEADGSSCDAEDVHERVSLLAAGAPDASPLPERLAMGLQQLWPDGRRQLSVCGNVVRVSGPAGETLRQWRLPGVVSARLSPDGERIAAVFGTSTRLIDLTSGPAAARPVELDGIGPVFSADGRHIATVSGGQTRVWSRSGEPLGGYRGVAPVFGPGGALMTVAGGSSLLWRAGAGPQSFTGTAPRVSPDGQWIMTTLDDGRTRVAHATGDELTVLDGASARFAPRGPVVVTARADGLVQLLDLRRTPASSLGAAARIWGLDDGDRARWDEPPPAPDRACPSDSACAPDGRTQVASYAWAVTPGAPFTAGVWVSRLRPDGRADGTGGPDARQLPPRPEHECPGPIAPIAFSPAAGHDWVLACGDGTVRVFDRDGVLRWEGRHALAVTRAVFAPDGRHLLSTSTDRTARLWHAATGEIVATLAGHESEVASASFAADGQRVATVTTRGVLRLWSSAGQAGPPLATIGLTDDAIVAAAFSRDGDWLIARTRKGQFRRWLARPDRLAHEFDGLDALRDDESRGLGLR